MLSSSFLEMRKRNAVNILRVVREQPGLSRADVARICDLARSTVSSVVDDLVQSELVQETGSKTSSRGRRPVGLMFSPNSRVVIGISLDDYRTEIVLCDLNGCVRGVSTKQPARTKNLQSIGLSILSEVQKLLAGQKIDRSRISGIGLAVPGPVQSNKNAVQNGENLDYAALEKLLSSELNCPIVIESNTNMAALAESRLGAARESKEALVVRLGHEVRSALIVDHNLLKGVQGRAGELGHIIVPGFDAVCKCGKRGCINAVAATDAILFRCRSAGAKVEDIDAVISAAIGGNRNCKEALTDAGAAVGYGIAICINILAPPDLMVTGRLVAAGDVLLNPLREAVTKFAIAENFHNCNLVFDSSHSHIEAIGASLAALLQEDFFLHLVSRICPALTEEGKTSMGRALIESV